MCACACVCASSHACRTKAAPEAHPARGCAAPGRHAGVPFAVGAAREERSRVARRWVTGRKAEREGYGQAQRSAILPCGPAALGQVLRHRLEVERHGVGHPVDNHLLGSDEGPGRGASAAQQGRERQRHGEGRRADLGVHADGVGVAAREQACARRRAQLAAEGRG